MTRVAVRVLTFLSAIALVALAWILLAPSSDLDLHSSTVLLNGVFWFWGSAGVLIHSFQCARGTDSAFSHKELFLIGIVAAGVAFMPGEPEHSNSTMRILISTSAFSGWVIGAFVGELLAVFVKDRFFQKRVR